MSLLNFIFLKLIYNFNFIILLLIMPKFIVFDGLIGAGKTTLIKKLEEGMKEKGLRVKALTEPVQVWRETGALEHFYKDIKQNCYEFQTFVYISRIKDILNNIENDIDIYLLERSIFSDRYIFVEMLKEDMGQIRMNMYDEWCELWKHILPFEFNLFIFLDTNPEISMERLHKRNRGEEVGGVSLEYQTKLREAHLHFYNNILPNMDYKSVVIDNSEMKLDINEMKYKILKCNTNLLDKLENLIK